MQQNLDKKNTAQVQQPDERRGIKKNRTTKL